MLKSIVCHCHLFLIEFMISRHLWCFHIHWCYPSYTFHIHDFQFDVPLSSWTQQFVECDQVLHVYNKWNETQLFLWLCYNLRISYMRTDNTYRGFCTHGHAHAYTRTHMERNILKWSLLYRLITFIPSIFWVTYQLTLGKKKLTCISTISLPFFMLS